MYQAPGRLPHLLKPDAYVSAAFAEREAASVFRGAWHMVGTTHDLARHGDFLTCRVMGHALIVRNIEGDIRTFSNACAHRHCLLKTEAKGRSPQLICPYHGWRYDAKGRVIKSRGERYFKTEDGSGERPALKRYRTALCGALIFVAVDDNPPSLRAWLGDVFDDCARLFASDWSPGLALNLDYPCNWKVHLENSLEGYHAPNVHPGTFRGDPDETLLQHVLLPTRTEFRSQLVVGQNHPLGRLFQRIERLAVEIAGRRSDNGYRHIHIHPNLTISYSDSVSVAQCIEPTSPTRSRGVVRVYGLCPPGLPSWRELLLRAYRVLIAMPVARRIIMEDFSVYGRTQDGLEGSHQDGLLGSPEERIHHFQAWILSRIETPP